MPGLYELQPSVTAYINYIRKDTDNDESINYNTERAKLVKVKRESEEIELSIKRKELHKADEIEKVMVDMLLKFKSRLMAMPSKLSPIMAKKTDKTEIFKIIKNNVYDALNELSDFENLFKEELQDGEENS